MDGIALRHRAENDNRNPSQPSGQSRLILVAAVIGFFAVTLDAVAVNVALPSIRHAFGGGIWGLQWVVDAYTLAFAGLLLSAGALSDRVGARRAFTGGAGVFTAASAACGLAPNLGWLLAARLVQGSAAAVLMPASMALLSHAFPQGPDRARAVGLWAMGGVAASTSGPLLGGLLTLVSWRLIFFVNLPAGAAALVLAARMAPSPRRRAPFDWPGQLTGVAAMGALTYGAIEAGAVGFAAPQVLAAFAVAVVSLAGFVVVEARVAHPIVPPGLVRSRSFAVPVAVGFAFVVGFYGLPFVMSLYLQQIRHLSPLATGAVFLPMALIGAVLTPFSAHLAGRFGARTVIGGGLTVMAAGLALLASVSSAAPTWALALLMVLVGMAGPAVMPPVTAVLLNSVPSQHAGTASGVFNTSRQVGGALAVAVFGALLARQPDLTSGLRASLLLAMAVALAAAAATALLASHPRPAARTCTATEEVAA
ncbi:MAG TPA: MFS transporter [Streptosporangiaceae bacterium]|nr:MFS transporter [Streptosporangiaceae bacterium]